MGIIKHSTSTPHTPTLGGEKVFFDISKIAHIVSNFLYIKINAELQNVILHYFFIGYFYKTVINGKLYSALSAGARSFLISSSSRSIFSLFLPVKLSNLIISPGIRFPMIPGIITR